MPGRHITADQYCKQGCRNLRIKKERLILEKMQNKTINNTASMGVCINALKSEKTDTTGIYTAKKKGALLR